jgi:hypothetical protein
MAQRVQGTGILLPPMECEARVPQGRVGQAIDHGDFQDGRGFDLTGAGTPGAAPWLTRIAVSEDAARLMVQERAGMGGRATGSPPDPPPPNQAHGAWVRLAAPRTRRRDVPTPVRRHRHAAGWR